ncbi:DMT family transporter [Anabaena azotica]|uniref:DMT family transporter n=1 Tax=Anabaena azotica FACHB-119 TaxID=947527 RepID=A0ABR8CZW4_9NOST|nr:DMT family transporter [Anabaena azotica]MBD2499491.1 DMT family transporter [Anabaena azotica FACHB-119]
MKISTFSLKNSNLIKLEFLYNSVERASYTLSTNLLAQKLIASALLFLGVCVISFGSILIKLSEVELSPNTTIFNRFWIASVVFLLLHGYKAIHQRFFSDKPVEQQFYTAKDLLLLLSAGIFWAITLGLLAWSLTQTSVAVSAILHNLAPIFTSMAAFLFFRQSFDRIFFIGMVIAIAGAIAIEVEEMHIATSEFQGGLAAIGSAIFLTAYLLTIEKLRAKFDPMTIQLWICVIASLTILPILLINKDQLFPSSVNSWLCVTSLALLCQVVGQGLITYSLARFSSVTVSLVRLLDPVLSSLYAIVIFSERLSFTNCLGFIGVLIGLYLAVSNQVVNNSLFNPIRERLK